MFTSMWNRKSSSPSDWMNPPPLTSITVSSSDIKSSWFLIFCFCLNLLTGLCGLCSCLLHAALVFMHCQSPASNLIQWIPLFISHVYGFLLGVVIIFQESESTFLLTYLFMLFQFRQPFTDSWIGRGLLLLFTGSLLSISSQPHLLACHKTQLAVNTSEAVSLVMLTMGVIHFCLGILCFQQMKEREVMLVKKRKQMMIQAQQLSEHKHEVEELMKQVGEAQHV